MDQEKPETSFLRDDLARDRTLLANERTFLAYLRTAIMLAASGVTMFKILGRERTYFVLGIALTAVSILVALFGYVRFQSMQKRIGDRGGPDHRNVP